MKLSQIGELSLLSVLRKRFTKRSRGLLLGIGDDAAVIRPNSDLLLSTDMMVEGVHFDLSWITPFQLGFKLISVNISDIYAMGGTPLYVLLNFSARRDHTTRFFDGFFDGISAALKQYHIALIGGDMSSSDKIMLAVTAVGSAAKVLKRSGARIGDGIYVTGPLGDSACGLELLRAIKRPVDFDGAVPGGLPLSGDIVSALARRHVMPIARNPSRFSEKATAMIDVSDGLLIDLSRLCSESGVGALVRSADIPVSDELKAAAGYIGRPALDFALSGGEDYELLFTAPLNEGIRACCIGEITASGVAVVDKRGRKIRMPARGYQHFSP
jgi:thiamine-monophosphate kinase